MKISTTSPYIALAPFVGAVMLYVCMPSNVLEAATAEPMQRGSIEAALLCLAAVAGVLFGYSVCQGMIHRPVRTQVPQVHVRGAFSGLLALVCGLAVARLLIFFVNHGSKLSALADAEDLRAIKMEVASNPIDLPADFAAPIMVAFAVLLWSGRLSLGKGHWAKIAVWCAAAALAFSGLIAPIYKGTRGELIVLGAMVWAVRTGPDSFIGWRTLLKISSALLALGSLFLLSAVARGQTGDVGYAALMAGYFVAPVNRVALLMSGGDLYLQALGIVFVAEGFLGDLMSLVGISSGIETVETWVALFDLVRSSGLNPAYNWITAPGALFVDMGYLSLLLYPVLGIAWSLAERRALAGSVGAASLLGLFFAAGLGFFGANNVLLAHGFWWVVVVAITMVARAAPLRVIWSGR